MNYIFLFISFITGCLVGLPLAQYGWHLLHQLSVRDGETYCREHKPISKENFIIAICHGLAWVIVGLVVGMNVTFVLYSITTSMLITLSIIDWLSYEIPPQFNIVILVLGFIAMALDLKHWYVYIIGAFAVSGLFFIMALASKGRAMGGGDIKLMFALGMLLGWQKILLVMFVGALLGSVIHITIMKVTKNKERMLSFGPYLAAGAYIVMLFGDKMIDWYLKTFLTGLYL